MQCYKVIKIKIYVIELDIYNGARIVLMVLCYVHILVTM
jgi:hypothetical protein